MLVVSSIFAVGVSVAVQVMLSVVVRPAIVPFSTVTSDASKLATASLNVKVTVVVAPTVNVESASATDTVGASNESDETEDSALPIQQSEENGGR